MREKFSSELKAAMKAGEKRRVDTIRMIMAALKDKDIEARGQGKAVSGEDILALLQKMVKSRKESLRSTKRRAGPTSRRKKARKSRSSTVFCRNSSPRRRWSRQSVPPSPRPAPPRSRTWDAWSPRSKGNMRAAWILARPARWSRKSLAGWREVHSLLFRKIASSSLSMGNTFS